MSLDFDQAWLSLSDEEIGSRIWEGWLEILASQKGVSISEVTLEIIANMAEASRDMEADREQHSALEKAVRLIAKGETASGGKVVRELILATAFDAIVLDEAATQRQWRKRISSLGRSDPLSKLIYELVRESSGKLSESDLLTELGALVGSSAIEEINDDEIWFTTSDGKSSRCAKISNLRGRLSTAKTKYNENSSR